MTSITPAPGPGFTWRQAVISHREVGPRVEGMPGFPPHDGQGPDVDPATGDERETTDENGEPL